MTAQLPIQKERLEGIARGEKCYTHDDVVQVVRALLAAHEQEPVILYRERNPYNGMVTGWQELTQQEFDFVKENASDNAEFKTLYTHPAPSIHAAPAINRARPGSTGATDLLPPPSAPTALPIAPSIPAVPDDVITICQRLIKEYIANKGTSSEFICCVTPSRSTIGTGGVWDDWKALDKACRAAMLNGGKS